MIAVAGMRRRPHLGCCAQLTVSVGKGAGEDVLGHLGKLPEQRYADAESVHRLLGADVDPHR
ncbi:hypothetical protein G3I59_27240 [Amycolatopsis rubida]|uniref:Uncharacterized protein n=1 Tax=Amycolatopsis rubida TaxID=112413 RepID=A0ABX0BU83_9PSEU|nr:MULTISPECIES: hypothetical protein [Amycolatopsis]MYW94193.1 hypothetical protein [Amycolatopsis rubida]NEC59182.1 hypothetical protein [Amycolatopsis rubida]OAP20876.1 hypothetical protein A4R44_08321 [Amycolatopsis sp. M39]